MYPERLTTLDVQVSVSQDYIGGLRLTPDGLTVVAAAADGVASLLEMDAQGRGAPVLRSVRRPAALR